MATFNCTLEQFKAGVAEFCKACPTLEEDQLDNGFKAVGLMYLGLPSDALTLLMGKSYLDYASRRHLERDLELSGL